MKEYRKNYEYGEGTYYNSGSQAETNGYGNVTMPGTAVGNISKYVNQAVPGQNRDLYDIVLLSHPVNDLVQFTEVVRFINRLPNH